MLQEGIMQMIRMFNKLNFSFKVTLLLVISGYIKNLLRFFSRLGKLYRSQLERSIPTTLSVRRRKPLSGNHKRGHHHKTINIRKMNGIHS